LVVGRTLEPNSSMRGLAAGANSSMLASPRALGARLRALPGNACSFRDARALREAQLLHHRWPVCGMNAPCADARLQVSAAMRIFSSRDNGARIRNCGRRC